MLTRCPHCQTAFRVTTEQLKVRQGRVRCGACHDVFDALESLSEEPPPGTPLQVESLPEEDAPAVASLAESSSAGLSPVEAELAAPAAPLQLPLPQPQPLPPEEPELAWEETPAPPRRWPWAIGVLLLLLVAALQLAYIYRVELAVLSPGARPLLLEACRLAGCTVPRPSKPELLGIESSDLAPAGGDHLLLQATLRNRAPFAQEYPYLELTLTDMRDETMLRKALAPADYLPAGQAPEAGFAAGSETVVRLELAAPGVPAVGYRLYLFYP